MATLIRILGENGKPLTRSVARQVKAEIHSYLPQQTIHSIRGAVILRPELEDLTDTLEVIETVLWTNKEGR